MSKTVRKVFLVLSAVLLLFAAAFAAAPPSDAIKVSITVIGDTLHQAPEQHDRYQVWVGETVFEVGQGASASDLLKLALDQNGMEYTISTAAFGSFIESISSSASLGSFSLASGSNSAGSGWMYTLNDPGPSDPGDYHPMAGIGEYILSDGDAVVVHYMDDWAEEVDPRGKHFKRWYDADPLPAPGTDKKYSGIGFSPDWLASLPRVYDS